MTFRIYDCDILDYSQILHREDLATSELVNQLYPWFNEIQWTSETLFVLNIISYELPIPNLSKYDTIIMSYHTENINVKQFDDIVKSAPHAKFIVLHDQLVNTVDTSNCFFVEYYSWHEQIRNAIDTHGYNKNLNNKNISSLKKFSALCNRATYSKIFVSNHVYKHYNDDSIVTMLSQIPELSSPIVNDNIYNIGTDNITSATTNFNWDFPLITNSVINITNETSTNNKLMYITEKTWRPILAGVAILHNGNPNFYTKLTGLGLQFKFNSEVNLSYDANMDPYSYLIQLCSTINKLATYSNVELYDLTYNDVVHNLQYIVDPLGLSRTCNKLNEKAIHKVLSLLSSK